MHPCWLFEYMVMDSLSNLITYLTAQCKVIPDMVKSLTDLESTLSTPVEDMNPFSYADVQQYYSNWVPLISRASAS